MIAPEIQTAQETAKKFVLPSKMQSMTDDRMANETHRANLDQMNSEFGWAERGGKLIRNMEGDATARTKWVPLDDRLLWQGRPDQNVSEAEARDFVRKALKSEPLQAKGHRFVNYLLDVLVEREKQIISLENEVEKAENNLTDAENQALDALMIEVETLIGKDEISKIFDRHADYTQTDGVRAWYDALTFAYQNAAEFAMRATHDKAQAGNKERMALMMAEISAEIGTNARSQHERTGKTKQADTGIAKEGNQAGSAENGTGTNALTLKTQTQAEITAQEQAQADHEAAQKSEEVAARAEQAARDQAAVDAKIKARTENPENFQFGESSKQAAAPVGDLFTQPEALSAIKKSDIPPADQIKLAADLRKGNVSPEDVQAVLGEAKPVEAQATIRGEEMKVGDDVHWMSGGTWDGVIQSIKPLPSGNHTLTIKASNGETITLDAAEHYGIALGVANFTRIYQKQNLKHHHHPLFQKRQEI